MPKLRVPVEWKGKVFHADLSNGYCLAIPLSHTHAQPNAFHAPLYEAAPHKAGDWIGDTREGAPVNFFDLRLNPHGNGTHTECVGHITRERYSVHETLGDGFWIAQLISVYPTLRADGDSPFSAGAMVRAGIPSERCHLFGPDGLALPSLLAQTLGDAASARHNPGA